MIAKARSLRITSKKINLIADLVRNKDVSEAITILKFTPKKGAHLLKKVISSALANAQNNFKQEADSLFIKEIIITEGATMKRSQPVSRGRAYPILKRTAHATIILGVKDESETAEKPATSPAPEAQGQETAPAETATASKKKATKASSEKKKTTT